MKKAAQIFIVCMIFAVIDVHAQQITLKDTANKGSAICLRGAFSTKTFSQSPIAVIPANFYSTKLGFFCKKELKLESVTKIPFRFRLGSLQTVDYMEGKPNSGYRLP